MRGKQYDNNMSGALFKNDKQRNDKDPVYKGTAEVDGVQYWMAAWLNESKDGEKYMSIKFTEKDDSSPQERNKSRNAKQDTRGRKQDEDMDDDIPF